MLIHCQGYPLVISNKPVDVSQAIHVWVSRKLPSIIIPEGTKQFLEEE